jgi:hypothetical protein
MSSDRIQYRSKFVDDVTTIILFKEDSEYENLKPNFEKCGFGFMIPGVNIIVIDGEKMINSDLLHWVEAHEATHLRLNHNSEYDPQDEIEADLGAYILLGMLSYYESCKMVRVFFKERHGIDFPHDRLIEISKKMGLYTPQEEFFNNM